MKTIHTEIEIDASAEKVWSVLLDFDSYVHWNDFIISIDGKPELDAKLTNTILSKGTPQTFQPTVICVEKPHKFEWKGTLPLGAFIGHHFFHIHPISNNKVKLIHGENFSGWLCKIILNKIEADTRKGFNRMNKGLKLRAESNL